MSGSVIACAGQATGRWCVYQLSYAPGECRYVLRGVRYPHSVWCYTMSGTQTAVLAYAITQKHAVPLCPLRCAVQRSGMAVLHLY